MDVLHWKTLTNSLVKDCIEQASFVDQIGNKDQYVVSLTGIRSIIAHYVETYLESYELKDANRQEPAPTFLSDLND